MAESSEAIASGPASCRERIDRLIALCEEQLRSRPGDVEGRIEIGRVLWESGQRMRALEYLRRLLEEHSGHPTLREMVQDYAGRVEAFGRGHGYRWRRTGGT